MAKKRKARKRNEKLLNFFEKYNFSVPLNSSVLTQFCLNSPSISTAKRFSGDAYAHTHVCIWFVELAPPVSNIQLSDQSLAAILIVKLIFFTII